MTNRTLHVNVYKVERCYGGSEEGGWWYNGFTPLESEVAGCSCDLPIDEWPLQDQDGDYIGWHAELDTWVGRHTDDCPSVLVFASKGREYDNFKDAWYYQQPDDDSEPIRGESFSSGKIEIRIELKKGSYIPDQIPMYS